MADLDAAIRAQLDDFCSDRCAEWGKAALFGVLDLHVAEQVEFIDRHGNIASGSACEVCGDMGQTPGEMWPCPTRVAIAEGLGIKTDA